MLYWLNKRSSFLVAFKRKIEAYIKVLLILFCFLLGLLCLFTNGAQAGEEDIPTEKLVMAIFRAEGGTKASVPYGIMFKGCSWDNEPFCRKICVNTVNNTRKRWIKAGQPKPFLEYLRDRYAPLSDHDLNKNWLKNVSYFLTKQNR